MQDDTFAYDKDFRTNNRPIIPTSDYKNTCNAGTDKQSNGYDA